MKNFDLILTFPFLRNGGAENIVIATVKELIKSDFNFIIITLYTDESIKKDLDEIQNYVVKPSKIIEKILKVRILRYLLGIPVYFYLLLKYSKKTKKFISFGTLPTYLLSIIKKFNKNFSIYYFECDIKIPTKYQFKYKDYYQRFIQFINLLFQDYLDNVFLNEVHCLITLCEKEDYNAKLQYSKIIKKFHIVNPPLSNIKIDLKDSEINLQIKNFFKNSKKYLAVVGALDEKKNPYESIKLFQYLLEMGLNDYELVFVGAGDMENSLKEFVSNQGLEKRVTFLGKLNYNETNYVFKKIYCNLFFAKYQSWGLTPLESLNFNKPSIVSSESGSSEFFYKHNLNHVHELGNDYACCLEFLENECKNFKFNSRLLEELYPENYLKKLLDIIF